MRWIFPLAICLAAAVAVPAPAVAAEAAAADKADKPDKDKKDKKAAVHKITQSESYLMVDPLYASIIDGSRPLGLLMLGIGLDVLVGILILGVFMFQIREQFDSLDIHHLEKLKDD